MPSTDSRAQHWWILSLAFIGLTLLPQILSGLALPSVGLAENRVLAKFPEAPANYTEAVEWPRKIDAYVQDNFPLRSCMIAGLNYVRFRLGYSATKNVIVGKDGWLFYDNGTHLAHALGTRQKLSSVEIDVWLKSFAERLAFVRAAGAQYYVIPGPQQESIYPEELPQWLVRDQRPRTEIDQIMEAATAKGYDRIVDPRPALIAAKASKAVYGPNDTHWNGNGAYVAYRELMTRVARDIPDLQPLPQSYFKPAPESVHDEGLALQLGIADLVRRPSTLYANPFDTTQHVTYLTDRRDWASAQLIETNAAGGRTLLLFRDSFATELIPLLKSNFSRIISVHVQDGFFRKDMIEKYKPDVVIVEVIESGLRWAMNQ